MNLNKLREKLFSMCQEEGSIRAWADKNDTSFSYVSSVLRGDTLPGKKILKAMGLRKSFSAKKTTVRKFEYIMN